MAAEGGCESDVLNRMNDVFNVVVRTKVRAEYRGLGLNKGLGVRKK